MPFVPKYKKLLRHTNDFRWTNTSQSLTAEQETDPERPPGVTDPDDVLMVYLDKLNDQEFMEGVIYLVKKGGCKNY